VEQRAEGTQAEYVADVREEVEHMSSLVSELLAFSKSQSIDSSVELQHVNVADTVRRVLQRESSEDARIETQVDDKAEVIAQPEYLFRSLANLVRNAVRYASHAGPILVSAVERGDEVMITVADSGPGLPESEMENVFRPFYRPEFARQRETGGAGLGLAIVRSCVEACGGAVSCRNRSPKGLEVAIRLARVPAKESA
jgi:two-component system sensor histidine kinase CpxA